MTGHVRNIMNTWRLIVASLLISVTIAIPNATHAEILERVVAVVNDEAVFLSELRRRAAPFIESLITQAPPGESKKQIDMLYGKLLDQLVDDILIEQTSREMHVTVTAMEVDQALNNVRQQNGLDETQFWQAVSEQGFTRAQYREDVRKQLLRLKVINQKVRSRVNVSVEEIRETYDDMVRKARRTQRFHAAHIMFPLPADASATAVSAAMKAAASIKSGLNASNFETKASALGGGDLGWLNQGDLPVEFENVLLDLSPGDISGPVRGPAGIHLFLLKERAKGDQQVPSFEESKASIEQQLVGRGMQRQEVIFLDQLRRTAVIDKRR